VFREEVPPVGEGPVGEPVAGEDPEEALDD